MSVHLYRVDCLTNMHVGSGDVNFGIIDQLVERDVVTGEPVINASGVKGALKEHCENKVIAGKNLDANTAHFIFGWVETVANKKITHPGNYKFLSASLIARPLRVSAGSRSHILVTTPYLTNTMIDTLAGFGIRAFDDARITIELNDHEFKYHAKESALGIEGCPAAKMTNENCALQALICRDYAVTNDLSIYDLPVVARNQLDDNGISNNLWYEEIVPHKSVFYFIIITPGYDTCLCELEKYITGDGNVVQFGGNATVGCGFTKITKAAEFNG